MEFSQKQQERFWSKVEKTPFCWNWTGTRVNQRYGRVCVNGCYILAHRMAYLIANGSIPAKHDNHRTVVMHTCDNPRCVNPSHLVLGTQKENMADARLKGRNAVLVGELNGRAKISRDVALAIKQAVKLSGSIIGTALRFGVTRDIVANIKYEKTWSSLAI